MKVKGARLKMKSNVMKVIRIFSYLDFIVLKYARAKSKIRLILKIGTFGVTRETLVL